uniref:Mos1 transposase HTH domain-containing protein n=1 Tax=Salarias fasciatus TaxID=181472 RepID=A0A672I955_SALFA
LSDHLEQRANIKFCLLLGKTAAETLTLLQQAYKDDALGKTQVYEWFGWFKKDQMSIEGQPKSGRPSTSRTAAVVREIEVAVMADRRRSIEEVADLTGISWSSYQRIISQDLGLHRVSAKMVPCLLIPEQKETGMDMCRQIKRQLEDDTGLLSKVITRCGATGMIQRPNSSPASGNTMDPLGQRKRVKSAQTQNNADLLPRCAGYRPQ